MLETKDKNQELAELIGRIALRDKNAMRALYERAAGKLFAILLRMLKSQELAEDAMQDVLVKVWQNAPSYQAHRGQAMTWLIGITRNRAIDILRQNRPEVSDNQAPDSQLDERWDPSKLTALSMQSGLLSRCLDELEQERRQCLVLAYCDGYSHSELSQYFDSPIGTVKSWIRRGLSSLKDCMGRMQNA